jgi:hypothetical protein
VNTLARQPELLPEVDYFNTNCKGELVQGIIEEALSESCTSVSQEEPPAQDDFPLPYVSDYSPSETSSGVEEIHTPQTSDLDSTSLSGRSLVLLNGPGPSTDLKLDLLVPPEVWAELLPVKTGRSTSLISKQAKTVPATDEKYKKLEFLTAVCGIHDVTATLQQWVSPGQTGDRLIIPVKDISTLEDDDFYGSLRFGKMINLCFIYRYNDGPMRICSFDHDEESTEVLEITHESHYQRVEFVRDRGRGWSILSVIHGGKIYNSREDIQRFISNADYVGEGDWPYIHFNSDTVRDEHLGKNCMTGVVFYTSADPQGIQCAVSMGTTGCLLTVQRQLANFTQQTAREVAFEATGENYKKAKQYQITLHKDIESPGKSDPVPQPCTVNNLFTRLLLQF